MQFTAIQERIESIRTNTDNINGFVEEYKPFIAACAEKVAGRYLTYGSDDELSIAMIAFTEAIRTFDQSRGNFFSFSRNVIKRRLIDYYRREKRHNNVISLNVYLEDQDDEFDLSYGESLRIYSDKKLADLFDGDFVAERALEQAPDDPAVTSVVLDDEDALRLSDRVRRFRRSAAQGLCSSKMELREQD
jgi:RNA polymerase sigma factor (sigma-70 family)